MVINTRILHLGVPSSHFSSRLYLLRRAFVKREALKTPTPSGEEKEEKNEKKKSLFHLSFWD